MFAPSVEKYSGTPSRLVAQSAIRPPTYVALAPVVVRNHPAITEPAKIGALMRSIDGYQGQSVTECALKLLPLVFVRPSELRCSECHRRGTSSNATLGY